MAVGVMAIIGSMRVYGSKAAQFLPSRLEITYKRFQQGTLGAFKAQLPLMLLLGLLGWVLEMARLYYVVKALGLEIGIALIPVVALGNAILSSVPTPGGVGIVEPGLTGLLLIGLNRPGAVSVTIVDRSITYLSIIIFGGAVFLVRHIIGLKSSRENLKIPN